jgi:hypothetical protein
MNSWSDRLRFVLPLFIVGFAAFSAPAQEEAIRVPIEQMWTGMILDINQRVLAPRKDFIADAQTWNTVWTAWRPNQPVPKINFGNELILVTTAPGETPLQQVSWRMTPILGDLSESLTFTCDEGPGFTYILQKVKLTDAMRSVNGILLTDPWDRPCEGESEVFFDGGTCDTPLTEKEAFDIAARAYIYGYPLVTMEMTRRVMTNAAEPKGSHAPMGRFANMREYPTAAFKDVTAPNADTLYSVAWLDLSAEPYVLSYPDMKGRYFLFPVLDAWTNVIASPGLRTVGDKAQSFALTGPNWKGQLPEGVKELKSPTNMVWILGRTYCTGTPDDYKAVHALQDQYQLVPLRSFGKPYTPPPGKVNVDIDMKTPVRDQVNRMEPAAYFKLLVSLMKDNPPAKEDAPLLARMARMGIVPGKDFDAARLPPNLLKELQHGHKAGLDQIGVETKHMGKKVNGWQMTFTGDYGTRYLFRAAIAFAGLGANLAKDAVYPATDLDAAGKPLKGSNKYEITFAKGQMPPVKGFWSLTMYNAQLFFVANPLNRYTLSQRNALQANADGSVTLYVQKESPGKDKETNWLPAPEGEFALMLRLYWPEESVLDGKWAPPAVKRVK